MRLWIVSPLQGRRRNYPAVSPRQSTNKLAFSDTNEGLTLVGNHEFTKRALTSCAYATMPVFPEGMVVTGELKYPCRVLDLVQSQ